MSERFAIRREGGELAGECWQGTSGLVALLHEGIADRRGWQQVAGHLAPAVTAVAYDRRGYGESPVSTAPFTHVDDLVAVLDRYGTEPAWLVGASAGGLLALDAALSVPDRVAGLVLIAPAVSGAPEAELDQVTKRFETLIDAAGGDLREANRLETWLWLDGPSAPQGRVGGQARALALNMNAIILGNGAPEHSGSAGLRAWDRLEEIQVPATVACGQLDIPFIRARSKELASRLPRGSYQELPGVAHQPYLEQPWQITELIRAALAETGPNGLYGT